MREERTRGARARIIDIVRCPRCGAPVSPDEGGVSCPEGHRFVERHGYLDFSEGTLGGGTTRATLESFGYEWNAFDEIREEDERFAAIYFRDLDLAGLEGKVGLDAGCGKGRFTRVLARHLAAVAALDGSAAAAAAARNVADLDNVLVIRSDLRTAPFATESFGFISSLGVLHHLDDPFEGFRRLVGHLAPGGQILLYLYSRPASTGLRSAALRLASVVRTLTVKLPHPVLEVLAVPIAACLYAGVVAPGRWGRARGVTALAGLPMDTYRDKPFRSLVLDTFDRLSAPVEHRYIWDDLEGWFSATGLIVDAARDETGWFVLAHRP